MEHCVSAFDRAPGIDAVVVVAAPEIQAEVRHTGAEYAKLAAVIPGGETRTDSTRRAIDWLLATQRAVQPDSPDWKVLFHDAARPLVDQRTIADTITALDQWTAVGVVVPSSDTIVEIADGVIERVLPRDTLARCQTPQGFRLPVIARAYERAGTDPGFGALPATDDCGVVLRYLPDVPVGLVTGSERNIKITYPGDLAVATALLEPGDSAEVTD